VFVVSVKSYQVIVGTNTALCLYGGVIYSNTPPTHHINTDSTKPMITLRTRSIDPSLNDTDNNGLSSQTKHETCHHDHDASVLSMTLDSRGFIDTPHPENLKGKPHRARHVNHNKKHITLTEADHNLTRTRDVYTPPKPRKRSERISARARQTPQYARVHEIPELAKRHSTPEYTKFQSSPNAIVRQAHSRT